MKTTEIKEQVLSGKYDALIEDLYADPSLLDYQKQRYAAALDKYQTLFGDDEVSIYSAAGRSEISGNHTDHQHGCVLAGSINLDAIGIVSKQDHVIKVISDDFDIKPIDLNDLDKTFVVYEYIDGKELIDLTRKLSVEEIENIGLQVGENLSKFKKIKYNKQEIIDLNDKEFNKLINILYISKDFYEKNESEKLYYIDLDRLCDDFLEYKKYVYKNEPTFIHGDINLHNVIVKDGKTYFIDTSNGKSSFRSLDFRGNCWFGWDGDNKINEQAMYRGIYKGLFNGEIPEQFNKELAFTIIYEFFLKINDGYSKKDMEKIKYNFHKFGDIFDRTNYFENYKFEWFE